MSGRNRESEDIGRFVRARREKTDASTFTDLPRRRRHVPYVTQNELGNLLGVSTVVISQIEQGRYPNLTTGLLHRIAEVLQLTQQQAIYLLGLLEPRPSRQKSLEPVPDWVIASVQLVEHPVIVVNPAYDVLSINKKAESFLGRVGNVMHANANAAISLFQMQNMQEFIDDWESYAASMVSGLKMSFAMYPEFRDYIDEMAGRIERTDTLFKRLWNLPDPLIKPTIEKVIHHSVLGRINILQVLTGIVEAPSMTRIEFFPADDEAREKFSAM